MIVPVRTNVSSVTGKGGHVTPQYLSIVAVRAVIHVSITTLVNGKGSN